MLPGLVARGAESVLRQETVASMDPFSIFEFAAHYDYEHVARLAIQYFGESDEFKDDIDVGILAVDGNLFASVPGRYVAAFFQAMARTLTPPERDGIWDWHQTSSDFHVDR
jgi:hypothetical protein